MRNFWEENRALLISCFVATLLFGAAVYLGLCFSTIHQEVLVTNISNISQDAAKLLLTGDSLSRVGTEDFRTVKIDGLPEVLYFDVVTRQFEKDRAKPFLDSLGMEYTILREK